MKLKKNMVYALIRCCEKFQIKKKGQGKGCPEWPDSPESPRFCPERPDSPRFCPEYHEKISPGSLIILSGTGAI